MCVCVCVCVPLCLWLLVCMCSTNTFCTISRLTSIKYLTKRINLFVLNISD